MWSKPAGRGDFVVVPHQQCAPSVFGTVEWKVVFGLEPSPLISREGFEWPTFDHAERSHTKYFFLGIGFISGLSMASFG